MKIGRMVETIAGETGRFYFISGSVSLKLGETMTSSNDGMSEVKNQTRLPGFQLGHQSLFLAGDNFAW